MNRNHRLILRSNHYVSVRKVWRVGPEVFTALADGLQPGLEPGDVLLDWLDGGEAIAQRLEPLVVCHPVRLAQPMRAGANQPGVDAVGLGAPEMQGSECLDLLWLEPINDAAPAA